MQWSSAVIVLGITAYYVDKHSHGTHLIYWLCIAAISTVAFLPAFISPFRPVAGRLVLAIDIIMSYLWLTAFIFACQDYDFGSCRANSPPGKSCSMKKANQAFIFLTFFFTFIGAHFEVASLWAHRRERGGIVHDKTGGSRPPMDAPAA